MSKPSGRPSWKTAPAPSTPRVQLSPDSNYDARSFRPGNDSADDEKSPDEDDDDSGQETDDRVSVDSWTTNESALSGSSRSSRGSRGSRGSRRVRGRGRGRGAARNDDGTRRRRKSGKSGHKYAPVDRFCQLHQNPYETPHMKMMMSLVFRSKAGEGNLFDIPENVEIFLEEKGVPGSFDPNQKLTNDDNKQWRIHFEIFYRTFVSLVKSASDACDWDMYDAYAARRDGGIDGTYRNDRYPSWSREGTGVGSGDDLEKEAAAAICIPDDVARVVILALFGFDGLKDPAKKTFSRGQRRLEDLFEKEVVKFWEVSSKHYVQNFLSKQVSEKVKREAKVEKQASKLIGELERLWGSRKSGSLTETQKKLAPICEDLRKTLTSWAKVAEYLRPGDEPPEKLIEYTQLMLEYGEEFPGGLVALRGGDEASNIASRRIQRRKSTGQYSMISRINLVEDEDIDELALSDDETRNESVMQRGTLPEGDQNDLLRPHHLQNPTRPGASLDPSPQIGMGIFLNFSKTQLFQYSAIGIDDGWPKVSSEDRLFSTSSKSVPLVGRLHQYMGATAMLSRAYAGVESLPDPSSDYTSGVIVADETNYANGFYTLDLIPEALKVEGISPKSKEQLKDILKSDMGERALIMLFEQKERYEELLSTHQGDISETIAAFIDEMKKDPRSFPLGYFGDSAGHAPPRAPHIVVAPPGLVEQWYQELTRYSTELKPYIIMNWKSAARVISKIEAIVAEWKKSLAYYGPAYVAARSATLAPDFYATGRLPKPDDEILRIGYTKMNCAIDLILMIMKSEAHLPLSKQSKFGVHIESVEAMPVWSQLLANAGLSNCTIRGSTPGARRLAILDRVNRHEGHPPDDRWDPDELSRILTLSPAGELGVDVTETEHIQTCPWSVSIYRQRIGRHRRTAPDPSVEPLPIKVFSILALNSTDIVQYLSTLQKSSVDDHIRSMLYQAPKLSYEDIGFPAPTHSGRRFRRDRKSSNDQHDSKLNETQRRSLEQLGLLGLIPHLHRRMKKRNDVIERKIRMEMKGDKGSIDQILTDLGNEEPEGAGMILDEVAPQHDKPFSKMTFAEQHKEGVRLGKESKGKFVRTPVITEEELREAESRTPEDWARETQAALQQQNRVWFEARIKGIVFEHGKMLLDPANSWVTDFGEELERRIGNLGVPPESIDPLVTYDDEDDDEDRSLLQDALDSLKLQVTDLQARNLLDDDFYCPETVDDLCRYIMEQPMFTAGATVMGRYKMLHDFATGRLQPPHFEARSTSSRASKASLPSSPPSVRSLSRRPSISTTRLPTLPEGSQEDSQPRLHQGKDKGKKRAERRGNDNEDNQMLMSPPRTIDSYTDDLERAIELSKNSSRRDNERYEWEGYAESEAGPSAGGRGLRRPRR
ncbi:hypothetical protein I203_107046 [Kwoniella mangroviensis CBS 8507]|uniref:hypothetical protein n=1 Tax=Kwoniella mangroviensis CBS 8507 TaxID=1296122 RepID=UPI00080CF765|nr:uncharacterized protein I203_01793 [Kwoniella mangroviensis CBS 8507]OCF68411.1 hypothetical protein I203_01793 [Kwoniella mangroviensis CBS 8507]